MTPSDHEHASRVRSLATEALEDLKARNLVCCDVRDKSSLMDYMLVASGTSKRHLRALTDAVVEKLKEAGLPPIGTEGDETTGWFLVDAGDVVIHVMSEESRAFYDLERLWLVTRPEA